jgi:hypothetical protein
LAQLAEAREWVHHYHRALWDEERHYAWWVSIILPSLAFVYVAPGVGTDAKRILITAGAGLGMALAWLGQHIVRVESRNFSKAMWRHEALVRVLGLDAPRDVPNIGRAKLYEPGFGNCPDEMVAANDGDRLVRFRRGGALFRIGIRSAFRLTFWLFLLVYAAIVAGVWRFPPPYVMK